MSSTYSAESVTPPAQGIVRATVAGSEEVAMRDTWRNRYVTVQADGLEIWVRFGVTKKSDALNTVTAVRTTVSAVDGAAPNYALAANASHHIPAGTSKDFDLSQLKLEPSDEDKQIRMAHFAAATTGFVRIFPSSGKASAT